MNVNNLKALYNNYCRQYSNGCALELLIEKYPQYEGELYAIHDGEYDVVPAEMKFQADVNFYDEEVNEMENQVQVTDPAIATAVFNTIVETATEVNEGEAPKIEKVSKKKEKKPTEVKAKKEPKVKAEKAPKAPSKAEQAREIYANAEDKSRAVITKLFMEQLGLTAAGSSTYMQNCKKWFESTQK